MHFGVDAADDSVGATHAHARYRPLGALRFFLAFMVVVQHGVHLLPSGAQGFLYAMGFGIVSVAVFFVISGFVVGEANNVFYLGRPDRFLLNRVLRIIPPYLAALVLEIAVAAYLYHLGKFAPWDYRLTGSPLQPLVLLSAPFAVLPGFHSRYISGQNFEFFPFGWTIRSEFAFYLFAAAVFWAMRTPRLPAWGNRIAGWCGFVGGYGLFALFLLRSWGGMGDVPAPEQFGLTPFFLVGICFYLLWRQRTVKNWLHLGLGLGCLLTAFSLWKQSHCASLDAVLAYQIPLLLVLLGVFAGLVFVSHVGTRWRKYDKFLGNLSYPLYLNHYVVLLLLGNLFPENAGFELYVTMIVISLLLAAGMHYLIETRLNGIRNKVRGAVL